MPDTARMMVRARRTHRLHGSCLRSDRSNVCRGLSWTGSVRCLDWEGRGRDGGGRKRGKGDGWADARAAKNVRVGYRKIRD